MNWSSLAMTVENAEPGRFFQANEEFCLLRTRAADAPYSDIHTRQNTGQDTVDFRF